jgi:hypothetical protein
VLTGKRVTDVLKERGRRVRGQTWLIKMQALFKPSRKIFLGLVDPEMEALTLLRKVIKYLPVDTT